MRAGSYRIKSPGWIEPTDAPANAADIASRFLEGMRRIRDDCHSLAFFDWPKTYVVVQSRTDDGGLSARCCWAPQVKPGEKIVHRVWFDGTKFLVASCWWGE